MSTNGAFKRLHNGDFSHMSGFKAASMTRGHTRYLRGVTYSSTGPSAIRHSQASFLGSPSLI